MLTEPIHGRLHRVVGIPGALAVTPAVCDVCVHCTAVALGEGSGEDSHAGRVAEWDVAGHVFFQASIALPKMYTIILGEVILLVQAAERIRGHCLLHETPVEKYERILHDIMSLPDEDCEITY